MKLSNLRIGCDKFPGSTAFIFRCIIDANIYLYHIMRRPKFLLPCHNFFVAIESGAYNGFTSTLVLNEVLHKLILAEATNTYGLRSEHDVANVLKQDPAKIRGLSQVWKTYSVIKDYPIIICSCDESVLNMAVIVFNATFLTKSEYH